MDKQTAKQKLKELRDSLSQVLDGKSYSSAEEIKEQSAEAIKSARKASSTLKKSFIEKIKDLPVVQKVSELGTAGSVAVSTAAVAQTTVAVDQTEVFVASVANDYVDGRINWIFGGNSNAISNYWRPSNSNESGNSTTPPAYTLNFDQEVDEWQKINYSTDVAGAETNSLYYVFYRSYVRSVFNPAKRMFKLTAYLPTSIIINYRLNDQIKIHDKMFRINSITTNLNTGKSELELLNIFTDEIVE